MRPRDGGRWGVVRALTVGALLAAAGAGCASSHRGEPFTAAPRLSAREQEGERQYMRHCNECHPGGEAGLGPALNNKPLPAFAIRTQVRKGVGSMPHFPEEQLADPALDALVDYVVALRRSE